MRSQDILSRMDEAVNIINRINDIISMNVQQLERLCFPITLRCNLRCKLCSEHSPYYEKPYHPSYNELTAQIDALFGLVEHIEKFDITGGEPILHNDLPRVIKYLHEIYRSKIGKLRITTNGTTILPKGFVEAAVLWGNDFHMIVDNYSVSVKSKIVGELLSAADISYELRDYSNTLHCDGWVDYGDLTQKHDYDNAKLLFMKCSVPKLGFFTCIVNGRIFPCAKARLLYENGIIDVSVDAFDPRISIDVKKKLLNNLFSDSVVEVCKYCNGLCDDSPRFMPAEQMSKDEYERKKDE